MRRCNKNSTVCHVLFGAKVKFQFAPFGFGKRICLGMSLAKSSIFIFFTMMIQNLKFEVDPGKPRPNSEDSIMSITHMPKPFFVKISPRKYQTC